MHKYSSKPQKAVFRFESRSTLTLGPSMTRYASERISVRLARSDQDEKQPYLTSARPDRKPPNTG